MNTHNTHNANDGYELPDWNPPFVQPLPDHAPRAYAQDPFASGHGSYTTFGRRAFSPTSSASEEDTVIHRAEGEAPTEYAVAGTTIATARAKQGAYEEEGLNWRRHWQEEPVLTAAVAFAMVCGIVLVLFALGCAGYGGTLPLV